MSSHNKYEIGKQVYNTQYIVYSIQYDTLYSLQYHRLGNFRIVFFSRKKYSRV